LGVGRFGIIGFVFVDFSGSGTQVDFPSFLFSLFLLFLLIDYISFKLCGKLYIEGSERTGMIAGLFLRCFCWHGRFRHVINLRNIVNSAIWN
jgi:hypothetical protein